MIENNTCSVCHKAFSLEALYPLTLARTSLFEFISQENPDVKKEGYLCQKDHQNYKRKYLKKIIQEDLGDISEAEQDVIESIEKKDILSENINQTYNDSLTFGERVADKISSFGGSWKFIFLFFSFLSGWMFLNTFILLQDQYDPYPYILLNLILSCLAAIQAPIIMMSQNRRGERERIESENDYKVNLKSELQIRHLNAKMDKFMGYQWKQFMEIQKLQADLSNDLSELANDAPDIKK